MNNRKITVLSFCLALALAGTAFGEDYAEHGRVINVAFVDSYPTIDAQKTFALMDHNIKTSFDGIRLLFQKVKDPGGQTGKDLNSFLDAKARPLLDKTRADFLTFIYLKKENPHPKVKIWCFSKNGIPDVASFPYSASMGRAMEDMVACYLTSFIVNMDTDIYSKKRF